MCDNILCKGMSISSFKKLNLLTQKREKNCISRVSNKTMSTRNFIIWAHKTKTRLPPPIIHVRLYISALCSEVSILHVSFYFYDRLAFLHIYIYPKLTKYLPIADNAIDANLHISTSSERQVCENGSGLMKKETKR